MTVTPPPLEIKFEIALANLGEYEEAITSYDKALKIKPDYMRVVSFYDPF